MRATVASISLTQSGNVDSLCRVHHVNLLVYCCLFFSIIFHNNGDYGVLLEALYFQYCAVLFVILEEVVISCKCF